MLPPTFDFEVKGLGTFRARKRTMRDGIRIEAEKERILGGLTTSEWLTEAATALAVVAVMVDKAPEGWNTEELDPFEPADVERLFEVFKELRAAEGRFRAGAKG